MVPIQKTLENPNKTSQLSFNGLGIAPKILDILEKLKFTTPTPIQHQSIPVAITGKDVLGIAQTGTGKTLAFGIPMIQLLAQSSGNKGLVILPTRELALQVAESLNKLGFSIGLKTAVLIGGESMHKQLIMLRRNPHIIISTPGRLIDHLEQKSVHLDKVKILVLDEADRMLDMGFAPQIKRILQTVPKDRQTMLFSATMPQEILGLATSYMKLPIRVEVAPAGTAAQHVEQELFFVNRDEKAGLLKKILGEYKGSILVFARTKFGAKKIAQNIRNFGVSSSEIHSNRSLNQRIEALNGFKLGKYRVLVATDIAARGIDVTGIEVVINYDLPENAADYVHRIGRTGRAGLAGKAISFATQDQRFDVRAIERLIRKVLPVAKTPLLEKSVLVSQFTSSREVSVHSDEQNPYHRENRGGFGQRKSNNYRDRPANTRGGYGGNRGGGEGRSKFEGPRRKQSNFFSHKGKSPAPFHSPHR